MTKAGGYRPDIDGLRAIAVLSVVLYHVNNAWVPGGYVGVDIFFVISGFLITRNIWGDLQAGHFSLADFYVRRVRRIAPAFLTVTAATLAAGMLLMMPKDMLRLAESAIWACFSAANIYYWQFLDTSYFAAAAAEEPLLHMWSLGVEEQFYLLWPALLMLLALVKRPNPLVLAATFAICVASFALAEATNVDAQKFSYYMLPTRAGELMIGALLALTAVPAELPGRWRESRPWLAEAASVVGLALIALAFWGLDDESAFPGLNALYPCVGAGLLILSGHWRARLTGWLLAARPMVYIGLISYSLYLWHWPILAFMRYFYGEIDPGLAAIALVATALLSVASYHWVERPTRRMRMPRIRQVGVLLVLPVVVIASTAAFIVEGDGLKAKIESSAQYKQSMATLRRQTTNAGRRLFPCMDSPAAMAKRLVDPRCVLGATSLGKPLPPSVFLWGDSNAGHYIGTLKAVGESDGFSFRYAGMSSCPSLFGKGAFGRKSGRKQCSDFRNAMREHLLKSDVQTVVLGAQWSIHQRAEGFDAALSRTISELNKAGKYVVILGQVPGFVGYNRDCALRWVRLSTANCEGRQSRDDPGDSAINDTLRQVAARNPGASYAGIHDVLCADGRCTPYVDQVPVYYNSTHLSAGGSYAIGRKIVETKAHDEWVSAFSGRVTRTRIGLIAGYQPGFPHEIRSQRHVAGKGGLTRHVVIVEYTQWDERKVVETMRDELQARGFSVSGPTPHGKSAQRYVAKRDLQTLVADVRANPTRKLFTPGARGTVYFTWKDKQPPRGRAASSR